MRNNEAELVPAILVGVALNRKIMDMAPKGCGSFVGEEVQGSLQAVDEGGVG